MKPCVEVDELLEQLVVRLRADYQPDKIGLFGSDAAGAADADSDLDLLIVKETDAR